MNKNYLKWGLIFLLSFLLLLPRLTYAQTRHTGRVISGDDKQAIPGASVSIKGTTTGTITSRNGEFELSLAPGNVLVISYVGYRTQQVTVGALTSILITLQSANSNLNEVVVTGYTSQRRKDIAGSVAVVDLTSARRIPTSSSDQLLQGQAAGVSVTTQGAPGANSLVYIRGISNFGNSQPLYVIDGVQSNSMQDVNPNDIASIQVLKDAGTAAIYGVSGGNGVVVITTKRGRQGKTVFSYDAYYGTQRPKSGNVLNILSPQGMSKLTYLAGDVTVAKAIYPDGPGTVPVYGFQGPGKAGVGGNTLDLSQYHFDQANPANDFLIQKFNQTGTDWFHELFKPAPIQYHTISASGANERNSYFLSVGYLDQHGTEINTYEKRYETRINTVFGISPHIRIGENGFLNYKEFPVNGFNNQNEGGPVSQALRIMPQIPVHDIAGNWGGTYDGPGGEPLGNASNPVRGQSELNNGKYRQWNIQGNVFAEADLFKHLTAKTLMAGNISNQYAYGFNTNPYSDYENHLIPNGAFENAYYSSTFNWTNTLLYKQTFGLHNLSVLAGYEKRQFNSRTVGGSGTNLFSTNPAYVNLSNVTQAIRIFSNNAPFINNSPQAPTETESLFARLDYIYNDKYIIAGTIRRDGFSAFYAGKQYGVFPAASLAWRISQENFFKSVTWLNDLKLRASYGVAGNNSNVPGANAFSLYGSGFTNGYYGINGNNNTVQGFYNSQLGNHNTTWETDKTANFGVDATVFNHLELNVEVYKKTISGLLFQASLPATVGGASAPYVNVGNVQNTGLDIALTYRGQVGSDFRYNIAANITGYRNKITSLPSPGYFDDVFTRVSPIVRQQIGHPIGSFFGYKVVGLNTPADIANKSLPTYPKAVAGSFKYQDVNGDGKIDDNDRTFIGNPNPLFDYGLNLSATYKNWDFSTVLYGKYGNKDFHYTKYFTDFYTSFQGAKSNDALYKSYGAPGVTNPTVPIQSDATSLGTTEISSYYIENGSFLKCRVLQIGYTVTPSALKGLGVDRVHIYIQGTNLFTLTKYTGLDPELPPTAGNNNSLGTDFGNFPNNQKQYIVGVNLSF